MLHTALSFGSYTNKTEDYYFWNAVVKIKIEYKGTKQISKPSDGPELAREEKDLKIIKQIIWDTTLKLSLLTHALVFFLPASHPPKVLYPLYIGQTT